MDSRFTRSFYKHMLGVPVTLADMEAFEPEFHKSLLWTLENNIEEMGLEMTFTVERAGLGVTETVELVPGGKDKVVTEANKAEYVKSVCDYKLTNGIQKQVEAFLRGFHEVIPEFINIFNEQELELLISGRPEIDLADLKANTEYVGYTAASPTIVSFWRAVDAMPQEQLAKLVMFVTGTAKVPLEGFK